jgi:hypothetical protein
VLTPPTGKWRLFVRYGGAFTWKYSWGKTAHCGDRNRLESLEYHVFKVTDKCEMFAKKMDRTLTCSRTRALLIFNLRITSLQSLEGSVVLKTCDCVSEKSAYHSRTREK